MSLFSRWRKPEAERPALIPVKPAAKAPALPEWAEVGSITPAGVALAVHADTEAYIRAWQELLGVETLDQYWLEVFYQCAKLDIQAALIDTPWDPRKVPVQIHFSRADRFALRNFPKGKGADAASRGGEARRHYARIRGRLPM